MQKSIYIIFIYLLVVCFVPSFTIAQEEEPETSELASPDEYPQDTLLEEEEIWEAAEAPPCDVRHSYCEVAYAINRVLNKQTSAVIGISQTTGGSATSFPVVSSNINTNLTTVVLNELNRRLMNGRCYDITINYIPILTNTQKTTIPAAICHGEAVMSPSEGGIVATVLEIEGYVVNPNYGNFYIYEEDFTEEIEEDPGKTTITNSPSFLVSPNPFTSSVSFTYDLAQQATVSLSICDMQGNTIRQANICSVQEAGQHRIWVDTENLPKGIYFYRIIVDGLLKTGKIVKL